MRDTLARLELHHGPGFGDHGSRVAILSVAIGHQLGLRQQEIGRLRLAAFIHDVGKTQIDPAILDKESALGAEEMSEVRKHPRIGYDQLNDSVHSSIAEAVLCHHERWDGQGYPSEIRKTAIPLFARIIFIADAFDVMTTSRSYRNPMSISQAGHELSQSARRQFDPYVLDAFASVDRRVLKSPANSRTLEPRLYAQQSASNPY